MLLANVFGQATGLWLPDWFHLMLFHTPGAAPVPVYNWYCVAEQRPHDAVPPFLRQRKSCIGVDLPTYQQH